MKCISITIGNVCLLMSLLLTIAPSHSNAFIASSAPTNSNTLMKKTCSVSVSFCNTFRKLSIPTRAKSDNDNNEKNEISNNNKNINQESTTNSIENINKQETKQNDLISYEELIRDPTLSQKEYSKSRQRKNNLFLLDDIGKAINVLLYAFVISSICLQSFGYGFVVVQNSSNSYTRSGGIQIGNSNLRIESLENKAFLLEMNGQDEQAAKIRQKLNRYK